MKKILILTLLLTAAFTQAQAQISDADAKLQYQQAEYAYERGDYCKAMQLCADLTGKLGKFTSRVLYLQEKSEYQDCIENNPNSNCHFKKSYDDFHGALSRCDIFFSLVNKETYPTEKYKDIQDAQQYFQQMQQKYAYEKDRTPEKAVAFLNECAKKFPHCLDDDMKESSVLNHYIRFYIERNYLIVVNSDMAEQGYTTATKEVTYIDLTQISGLSKENNSNYGNTELRVKNPYRLYLTGAESYSQSGAKELTGLMVGTKVAMAFKKKEVSATYQLFNDTTFISPRDAFQIEKNKENNSSNSMAIGAVSMSLARKHTKSTPVQSQNMRISHPNGSIDLFDNFNMSSQEFQAGNYANRIQAAFQYLIDYFPKSKPQQNNVQQDNSNGF